MNTTIIILGVAILIVIIAIVFVLVNGKDSKEETPETNLGNTFKEESNTPEMQQEIPEPQSQMTTPQLHQQDSFSTPVQNAPVLNDLNTPMPSQNGIQQENPTSINQPNPLPDETQMQNDMANLENSMNEPNSTPNIPVSGITQNDDVNNIANTINTQIEEDNTATPLTDQTMEQPIENPIPTSPVDDISGNITEPIATVEDASTVPPSQDEAQIMPNVEQLTPMEEATSPIDITSPIGNNDPMQQTTPDTTNISNNSVPPVTPPPVNPM